MRSVDFPALTDSKLAWQSPVNLAIALLFGLFVIGVLFVLYEALLALTLPSASIQATVVLGALFCLLHGMRSMGSRRIGSLLILTLTVTLVAETLGVLTGLLFGEYQYNGHLGDQFLGLVPFVIPPAWFMMLYPSYIIALRLTALGANDGSRREFQVALLGAAIMTTWDFVIDPVMVKIAFWEWETGRYFGVPFTNYLGWFIVSFVVLYVFGIRYPAGGEGYAPATSGRILTAYYGLVGISSAIAATSVGLVGPAALGMAGMSLWVVLGWRASMTGATVPAPRRREIDS